MSRWSHSKTSLTPGWLRLTPLLVLAVALLISWKVWDSNRTYQRQELQTAFEYKARKTSTQDHQKVTEDTASLNFNTAISQMMIYSNELAKLKSIPRAGWEPFVLLIAPYAPHLGEELWEKLGHRESISKSTWPIYREEVTRDEEKEIVVQINGRVRSKFWHPREHHKIDSSKWHVTPKNPNWLEGKEVSKIITVPDKLVNFVLK